MKKKPSKLKQIVRDPNGPFRMRVVSDKKKYTRKTKHKNKAVNKIVREGKQTSGAL